MFELQDLLLAEPRLRLLNRQRESVQIHGVCGEGDGDPTGWLLLVDGAAISASEYRHLAKKYAPAAALMWHGQSVPDEMVLAAGTEGVPIVHLPEDMDRRIIYELAQQLDRGRPDASAWRRLMALSHFSKSLVSKTPEQDLLAKYLEMTRNAALLLTMDGEVLASAGELPVRTIVRSLRGAIAEPEQFHIGRWLITAVPVDPREIQWNSGNGIWFVVGRRDGSAVQPVRENDPVVSAALQLLNVAIESRRQLSHAENFRSSRVVSELISGRGDADQLELQLTSRGFQRNGDFAIVVAGNSRLSAEPGVAVDAISIAAQLNIPIIVAYLERRIVVVVAWAKGVEAIVDALPEPVGVSAPVGELQRAPHAYRQSKLAYLATSVARARTLGRRLYFNKSRPLVKAVSLLQSSELAACSSEIDNRLAAIADGYEFGTALVEEGFDLRATARRCGVHVNTVRNRLAAVLDDDHVTRADLELWYFAHRLLE